jgi:hypothetical protein
MSASLKSIQESVAAFLDYNKHHLTAEAGLASNRATLTNLYEDQLKAGVVSPWLADHVRETLRDGPKPPKRGRKPYALWLRDRYIAEAVFLAKQSGATTIINDRASPDGSACWIVAEALGAVGVNMREDAVYKIWKKQLGRFGLGDAPPLETKRRI